MLNVFILSVTMLSINLLNVIMLSVTMLSINLLIVFMLSVTMLNINLLSAVMPLLGVIMLLVVMPNAVTLFKNSKKNTMNERMLTKKKFDSPQKISDED